MPVKVVKGETPIKCNGKLFIIDGGFSKAYQKVTGIAGYTLVYNSYGLLLVAHDPFVSVEEAVLYRIRYPFAEYADGADLSASDGGGYGCRKGDPGEDP